QPPVAATNPRQSGKPLGFVLNPVVGLLLFCCETKIHQPGVTYISVAPVRMTVLPLPNTSHATPRRGAKLFLSGLYIWPVFTPNCSNGDCVEDVPGTKFASSLCPSVSGVTYS